MSEYEVRVFSLSVERRATEAPFDYPGELGDIQTIEVGATRSKPSETNAARYTVSYGVRDGIAEVRSVEPTERSHSNPAVKTKHLGHILAETDSRVRNGVPDVEAVRSLTQSLRNERAKHEDEHPHANTDEHEAKA